MWWMRNLWRRGIVAVQDVSSRPGLGSREGPVLLSSSSNLYCEGPLKSYSAISQSFLKRYTLDDIMAKRDTEVRNLKQGSTTPADFIQAL